MSSKQTKPVAPPAPDASREERVVAWLTANRTPVLVGLGAVVAIVLVTWGFSVASARKEAAAQARIEAAWNAQDAGNLPVAATEFQAVIDGFSGTSAALEASLAINQVRLLNGQSQEAAEALRAFLAGNPPPRFRASAGLLLGSALENLGQAAEAAQAYEAASAAAEEPFRKAEALVAAGRAWRAAGDRDAAIRVLTTVVQQYKETASFPAAEVRLGELMSEG